MKNHSLGDAREPLLVTIDEAARRLGLGRSSVYELLKSHQLEVVRIGRATRIPTDSVAALVQRLRGAA
jgi:excisionase family DNA binding protein